MFNKFSVTMSRFYMSVINQSRLSTTGLSSSNLFEIRDMDASEFENLVGQIMMFNASFINISVISWRSVLLMEKS